MTESAAKANILLVGPLEFQERATESINSHSHVPLCIVGKRALNDLDDWGHDLILFRLSAHDPDSLENLLSFLVQENRPDAVAVVAKGEEDLGVGAVVRGALNFVLDERTEYAEIGDLACQTRKRRERPLPSADVISSRFDSEQAFHTVCQPIVELDKMTAIGWEFLSRGPQGPFSQPARFFRWGERHDRLIEFDLACLEACLTAASKSHCQGRFHFNIFPQTVATPEMDALMATVSSFGDGQVCFEISESALAQNQKVLRELRQTLRSHHINLAIDDIGFQARGLSAVRDLRPEVLKIDRRVISHIRVHQTSRDLVSSVLKLSESLGAVVIAEGVELESELVILKELGVQYAQGYLWGKPTRPDEATKSLKFGGSNQEQS